MATSLSHHLARRANSIGELWAKLNIPPRRPNRHDKHSEWRLVQPPEQGYFSPMLDKTLSVAVATDGCHVLAEKFDGTIIEGHVTNWVKIESLYPTEPHLGNAVKVEGTGSKNKSKLTVELLAMIDQVSER